MPIYSQLFVVTIQVPPTNERLGVATRKPQRLSITMPAEVYEVIEKLSFQEGRSMSNLASFLLENAVKTRI